MPRQSAGPDWRHMDPADFGADYGPLFTLDPDQVVADDGHGTGDLLELVTGP